MEVNRYMISMSRYTHSMIVKPIIHMSTVNFLNYQSVELTRTWLQYDNDTESNEVDQLRQLLQHNMKPPFFMHKETQLYTQ